jgi:outer membrane protein OmpA-like peptidoglycan-associated protein
MSETPRAICGCLSNAPMPWGDLVRMGISANRLTARGFSEEDPIADNATAEGRATNRRVSVAMAGR